MTEYMYRVLDRNGENVSGYNNRTGTFASERAARMCVLRNERDSSPVWKDKHLPCTVERSEIHWEPLP